jgi:ATP-dependent DNA helicase RecQ
MCCEGRKRNAFWNCAHDQLSTYGIGKDRSTEEWKLLGRSLLHQGLVEETTDGFPVLKLNAASWQVLRQQLSVQIAIPETLKGDSEDSAETSAEAAGLLAQLRSLRKRLADAQGIPPYIVVYGKYAAANGAQRMPRSLTQFSRISGGSAVANSNSTAKILSRPLMPTAKITASNPLRLRQNVPLAPTRPKPKPLNSIRQAMG